MVIEIAVMERMNQPIAQILSTTHVTPPISNVKTTSKLLTEK